MRRTGVVGPSLDCCTARATAHVRLHPPQAFLATLRTFPSVTSDDSPDDLTARHLWRSINAFVLSCRAIRSGLAYSFTPPEDRVVTTSRDLTQALYVAAVALGRTRDAEEVVRAAIAETQRASGVEAVSLYLLDASRNTLILREYAGTTPAFREQMTTLPLSQAEFAATAIRERLAVTRDVNQHPTPSIRNLYQDLGTPWP